MVAGSVVQLCPTPAGRWNAEITGNELECLAEGISNQGC